MFLEEPQGTPTPHSLQLEEAVYDVNTLEANSSFPP